MLSKMWREILIEDKASLTKYVGIWNDRIDCVQQISTEIMERILTVKNGHIYIYEGSFDLLLAYKPFENTSYVFQMNSNVDWNDQNIAESWDAHREIIKTLLLRHNRPVRIVKSYENTYKDSEYATKVKAYIVIKCAESGIKATELEHEWLYELM